MEKSQPQPVLERRNAIKVMWESGMTSGEISKEVGVSRSAVMGVVFRLKKKNVLSGKNPIKISPRKTKKRKDRIKEFIKINNAKPNNASENYGMEFLFKKPKKGKTVVEIEGSDCRYMIERGVFCAQPGKSILRPWCEDHYPLRYVKSRHATGKRNWFMFGITRKAGR